MFFSRPTTLFSSLFFLLLIFTFSGCTQKEGGDTSANSTLSVDRHNTKDGALPDRQNLLYKAAVESGLQNDTSIEGLVNDYRKNLYGNLFLEHYLSSRIEISMEKIREHYIENRVSYVRQSNQVRLIQFLTQN